MISCVVEFTNLSREQNMILLKFLTIKEGNDLVLDLNDKPPSTYRTMKKD